MKKIFTREFQEGRQAAKAGIPLDKNPYANHPTSRVQLQKSSDWDEGHYSVGEIKAAGNDGNT